MQRYSARFLSPKTTRLATWLSALFLVALVACPRDSAAQSTLRATRGARFQPTHTLLQDHVAARKIAGAVALVFEGDRVIWRDAVGWQDVESKQKMKQENLFRIASMTKPVTSVAVMMLAERGVLKLSDPLEKFVPDFRDAQVVLIGEGVENDPVPARRAITIHDLLTHTSGLTYRFSAPQPQRRLMAEAQICEGLTPSFLTLAENTRRLADIPLVHQPGSAWHYGLSTDVLGRVVEVAAGQTFDRFVQEQILEPLQMTDTHFVVPRKKLPRVATLYRPTADETIQAVGPGIQTAGTVRYSADFPFPGVSDYRSGGAGLVSTANDYLRFLRMILHHGELDGTRLLTEDTVRRMTRNQIGELGIAFTIHGDKFGYGFGVHSDLSQNLNGATPGTCSWGGIFHTYFWVDPERDVIGILMTQLFPFDHLDLWAAYQQHVYDALDGTADASVERLKESR